MLYCYILLYVLCTGDTMLLQAGEPRRAPAASLATGGLREGG